MPPINLHKLLVRDKDVAALITTLIAVLDADVGIQDADGALLVGRMASEPADRYPLALEDALLGWVVGDTSAVAVAAFVSHIVKREYEKKCLAREVLDRYRELNLLYDVSEKISASLQVAKIATVAIAEARRLIKSGGGLVLLLDPRMDRLRPAGALGEQYIPDSGIRYDIGILGGVAASGKAEIVNELHADPRAVAPETALRSVVCAPLVAKQRVIGLLLIGSAEPVIYTAADLKFLSTIASQAAPAIDNAMLYERTVNEAQEREHRLQQQLAALRIEVDRVRRGGPAHN